MQGICSDCSKLKPLYTPGDEVNNNCTDGEDDEEEVEAGMTDHHEPEGGDLSDIEDEGQGDVVTDIEDDKEDFPPGSIVWARYVG